MAPGPLTPTTAGGHGSDVAGVLGGLAALGYDGIATAVRVVREQTGLTAAELAIQVGLPPVALALWERGSFIPRTHHLLRLATLLAAHQRAAQPPITPPTRSPPAHNTATDMTTNDQQGAPPSDDPADRPPHRHPHQHHGGG